MPEPKQTATVKLGKERLERLINLSPAVHYVVDVAQDQASYFSEGVKAQLGYEPAQFTQDSEFWVDHLHPDDRPRVLADLEQLLEVDRHVHEYRFRHADGSYRWMHDRLSLVRDKDGDPFEIIGSWLDITMRKEAEEALSQARDGLEQRVEERTAALRLTEARLNDALRIGKMGNYSIDLQTNQVWRSDELHQIFGLSAADSLPTLEAFFGRVHPDDRQLIKAAIERAIVSHRPYSMEYRFERMDGTERIVHTRSEVRLDDRGRPSHLVGTVQDVTRERAAEAALERSHEELRELSRRLDAVRESEQKRVARDIHDDLGQTLTGIKMYSAALRQQYGESDQQLQEKLDAIVAMVDEAFAGTDRVLRGLLPPVLHDANLPDALGWLVEEHRRLTGQNCEVWIPNSPETLTGPWMTPVFRVVQEALTNVSKHAQANQVRITVDCDDDEIILRVADDGIGFEFDESFRSDRLGLIGMRERALASDGRLEITSQPGGGTTVELRVPRFQKTATEPSSSAEPRRGPSVEQDSDPARAAGATR